jgi:hypothetical protein
VLKGPDGYEDGKALNSTFSEKRGWILFCKQKLSAMLNSPSTMEALGDGLRSSYIPC